MTDASGGCVHQAGHAGPQLAAVMRQVVCGKPLRIRADGVVRREAGGHFDCAPCGHRDIFGVAAKILGEDDGIAEGEILHCATDSRNRADTLAADQKGLVRPKRLAGAIGAFPLVDITERDACVLKFDDDLVVGRGRIRHLAQSEDVRSAKLGHDDGAHMSLPLGRCCQLLASVRTEM